MIWKLLVGVAVLAAAGAGALWAWGRSEPIYAISEGEPVFFVALKTADPAAPLPPLAAGVELRWQAQADFTLIGEGEPYWTRFAVLAGGAPDAPPLALDGVSDAYVVRLRMVRPPALALGVLKLLIATGVLPKPEGAVAQDVSGMGFRADAMPTARQIETLLAKPADYAPSMVNFLKYRAQATAPDEGKSGAAAYQVYGLVAMRTVYRTGGRLLFYGRVEQVLRAPSAVPPIAWDDIAVMQYPSSPAILTMEHVPEYRAALKHRDAGLDRTVVIAAR